MNKVTFTLLVWEQLPEDVKYFLIPNKEIDEDEREMLEKANNTFVNVDDDPIFAQIVNAKLSADDYDEAEFKEYYDCVVSNPGKWNAHRADMSKPLSAHITHVYVSGFYE